MALPHNQTAALVLAFTPNADRCEMRPCTDCGRKVPSLKRCWICRRCRSNKAKTRNNRSSTYRNRLKQYLASGYSREYRRKQNAQWQSYLDSLKANTPCKDCEISYPHYMMEFDHVRGEKLGRVSGMKSSKKKMLEELAKCEIVCANCHRRRTFERGENKGRRKE